MDQALLRGVVLIRRRIRPNLPLPPGKQFNFYLIHNQKTSGSLANALCNSLEKLGGRIFRPEMVTVHGTNGSHSRWHQTTETSMGLALHKVLYPARPLSNLPPSPPFSGSLHGR